MSERIFDSTAVRARSRSDAEASLPQEPDLASTTGYLFVLLAAASVLILHLLFGRVGNEDQATQAEAEANPTEITSAIATTQDATASESPSTIEANATETTSTSTSTVATTQENEADPTTTTTDVPATTTDPAGGLEPAEGQLTPAPRSDADPETSSSTSATTTSAIAPTTTAAPTTTVTSSVAPTTTTAAPATATTNVPTTPEDTSTTGSDSNEDDEPGSQVIRILFSFVAGLSLLVQILFGGRLSRDLATLLPFPSLGVLGVFAGINTSTFALLTVAVSAIAFLFLQRLIQSAESQELAVTHRDSPNIEPLRNEEVGQSSTAETVPMSATLGATSSPIAPAPIATAPASPPAQAIPAPIASSTDLSAAAHETPRTPTASREFADFHIVLGEEGRAENSLGEIPTTSAPFSSGFEADQFTSGEWTIQARSSRGASHVHGGEFRQDAYALGRSANGEFVFAAIADGVGSAAFSNFGSYVATRAAVALLAKSLTNAGAVPEVLRGLPKAVSGHIREFSQHVLGANVDDVATTLVVAVVQANSAAPIWLARIGDSDALVLTKSGNWASGFGAGSPSDLETGATDVLPHHADRVEVRMIDGSKAEALLLATDGISRVIEGSPDVVGRAFSERLAEPIDSIEFEQLIDFKRRGAHDDRTAVAMWHRPKGRL